MAALARWKTFLSVFRSSFRVVLSDVKPAVCRVGSRSATVRTVASIAAGAAFCAVPFKQVEDLSHESLIRRAASLVTDSSSTFLSQTTIALIEAAAQYSTVVHSLVDLQRRYLNSLGKLSQADEDAVWQLIIAQRAQVSALAQYCERLEQTWASAVRVCEASAEAAFSSGADHAAVTIRTNLELSQTQVQKARSRSTAADRLLTQTKVLEVQRVQPQQEEQQEEQQEAQQEEQEEVPDAYLRED
ncbi:unnamed protein product [Knipowitschia caucasica]|uniref:Direct IAP-binding protein with low pI n=1 Tax=Knipowitschia caucasica TaxID=637954 RepID=A0AAV2J865_KNICA